MSTSRVWVNAYRRDDGVRVSGHWRVMADVEQHTVDALGRPRESNLRKYAGGGSEDFGGGFSVHPDVSKASLDEARRTGRAVLAARKGKRLQAKMRARELKRKLSHLGNPDDEIRDIRRGALTRQLAAVESALDKGKVVGGGIKSISRRR